MNTGKPMAWTMTLISLLMVTSCGDNAVYHSSQNVEETGWHYRDTLRFDVFMDDTLALHELYLDVRNTTDYDYRNLFLFMDIEFPGGRVLRDTLECILAERDGSWTGKGFGRIKSNRFLFRDDVWFPEAGTYSFRVAQGMRHDTLTEVKDIGIRIERK